MEEDMKWMGIYLLGYSLLVIGGLLALWKTGLLASIGPVWTAIGLVILIGLGIMIAVTNSGEKKTIEVDRT
jgi:hypothetical protein